MKTINLLVRISAYVAEGVDVNKLYVDLTGMRIMQPGSAPITEEVVPHSDLEYETIAVSDEND